MTEILSETYATARDSWVDFVQGKPGEATPAQINGGAIPSPDFIALMHQAKADANAKIEREKNKFITGKPIPHFSFVKFVEE